MGNALSEMPAAHAQTAPTTKKVNFVTPVSDAVPGRFFDRATSRADTRDPNKLIIGLNRGINPTTALSNTFTASTQAFFRTAAMDTIHFNVQAMPGYYLSAITYTQRGICSTARTGAVAGGANWSLDGVAREIGLFASRKCEGVASNAPYALTGKVLLTDRHRSALSVSITSALFAFSTPALGAASINVTSGEVLVEACAIALGECPCVGDETAGCLAAQ
jgi:hypothetical protein